MSIDVTLVSFCYFWTYFMLFSSDFMNNFEWVNASWE